MANDIISASKRIWDRPGAVPVTYFENKEEMKKYAKKWMHALFLDDWIIAIGYHTENEYPNENGHIEFDIENKTGRITLLKQAPDDRIFKHCEELILVHELLHLKIGFLNAPDTVEGMLWEVHHHGLIYEMSKSLICAKYNLDYEWFKNHDSVI